MLDINKHRFHLVQILNDVYSNLELANTLGFKEGTAMMFLHGLPRFSVDLDFNLLEPEKEESVYRKFREILLKYGKIHDEAMKHFGPILVLDYGFRERKLKVEISNRPFSDRYEIKHLLGIDVRCMVKEDMFSHKLCAILDRPQVTGRDVFDSWYFMKESTALNPEIIRTRMHMETGAYLQKCIEKLENLQAARLLQDMGELLSDEMKTFAREKLVEECIRLMKFYQAYPIIEKK